MCEVVPLGVSDTHRLARHLESIAKALTAGDLAKARILGLYFPINRLAPGQLARLRKASTLLKQFNPDEPRDDRGRWTTGAGTASSANSFAPTRGRSGTRESSGTNPVLRRIQEILIDPEILPPIDPEILPPIDPEILPDAPVEGESPPVKGEAAIEPEEPFPHFGRKPGKPRMPKLDREYCLDAARRSPDNMAPWDSMCRNLPADLRRDCWSAGIRDVQAKEDFCDRIFPQRLISNVQN